MKERKMKEWGMKYSGGAGAAATLSLQRGTLTDDNAAMAHSDKHYVWFISAQILSWSIWWKRCRCHRIVR
jgi:hypothetical protein